MNLPLIRSLPMFALSAMASLPTVTPIMPIKLPYVPVKFPTPVNFTIVRGDVDAWVVSEYEIHASPTCMEVVVDSVTRGVPNGVAGGSAAYFDGPEAVTVHWSTVFSSVDSAALVACTKIRRSRHVAAIPGAASLALVYPPFSASPNSLFECHNGTCSKMPNRVVDNSPDLQNCLVGALAPAPSRDAALDYIRRKVQGSAEVFRLDLIHPTQVVFFGEQSMDCYYPPIETVLDTVGNAEILPKPSMIRTFLPPPSPAETRIQVDHGYMGSYPWYLPSSTTDTTVTTDLALPSPGNAGDWFRSEAISYTGTQLKGSPSLCLSTDCGRIVGTLSTGIKHYEYIGRNITTGICGETYDQGPTIFADTLRLDGQSIILNNQGCPRKGIDVFAGKHNSWLVIPSPNQTMAEAMWHGSSIENGTSWPIDGDSVLVRGWNISYAEVMDATSSVTRFQKALPGIQIGVVGVNLQISLAKACAVDLLSADGRILSRHELGAGKSTVRIPGGAHGLLMARTNEGITKVVVP